MVYFFDLRGLDAEVEYILGLYRKAEDRFGYDVFISSCKCKPRCIACV